MHVSLFDFDLPPENIALRPAEPRDASRLLLVRPGRQLEHFQARDLPDLLQPGDALVFNDTRVIPAQLEGVRHREGAEAARFSATLHMRVADDRWKAFVKGAKKLKAGDHVRFGSDNPACDADKLDATVAEKGEDGEITFAFEFSGPMLDQAIATVGHIPLPPYIAAKRPEDARDRADYQTVYAREDGAVAAPTAGLHFTPDLLDRLAARGIDRHFVTLHVGAGTFLPMKVDTTEEHKMHSEVGYVTPQTAEALNAVRARGGRVVAVGTTSLRLLESATGDDKVIRPFAGPTDIFITPGYRFKAVDLLMTNFHLPKSTLFMLVSAFSGLETMRAAYAMAIESGYRFYSYGDTSLLYPAAEQV
ncbi:tRNA preQ1(34) S-adenosylmethionine ribosyltransferase-isomerase QueA [Oryzibacter oryziterrae]|uniref:tRNA preQ1(34) S-adenosylmethionine ribosyltransferase-isomerase QueA n=1 Tax=Oryzibacter oryziterrae TaxID=2766474 RepID=UPI001F012119|nr:tRNA preQ1(34) S-adenosylmethionine ribosyltransferase-isomerase QueA [Oryzibacter oryziterrae]